MTTNGSALSAMLVSQTLAESGFNLPLTAERLGVTSNELLNSLSLAPEALEATERRMRLQYQLELFKLWRDTQLVYLAALGEAQPRDVLTALTQLTDQLGKRFTQPVQPQNNLNAALLILNMLPSEVRDSVLTLLEGQAS